MTEQICNGPQDVNKEEVVAKITSYPLSLKFIVNNFYEAEFEKIVRTYFHGSLNNPNSNIAIHISHFKAELETLNKATEKLLELL